MAKKVLITGASKGIGLAIATRLLQEGMYVVGIGRQFPDDLPERLTAYSQDLDDLAALPDFFKKILKEHCDIDALICNAGKGLFGSLEEFSYEQIHSLFNVNFLSAVYLAKAFLPHFKRKKQGDLIFIGSESALQGKRKGSLYCASKFALRGFAQALREECATSDIRITLINPGMVKTPFFEHLDFEPGNESSFHLLPEDVAQTVSFVINAREGVVMDEINLSPQKKKIEFKPFGKEANTLLHQS